MAKPRLGRGEPPTIRYALTVLSAIFTTALNDQITFLRPCMGLKALAAGKDSPRQPRRLDTDGHIPRAWFRRMIWNPALHALNRLRSECLGYWASVGW